MIAALTRQRLVGAGALLLIANEIRGLVFVAVILWRHFR